MIGMFNIILCPFGSVTGKVRPSRPDNDVNIAAASGVEEPGRVEIGYNGGDRMAVPLHVCQFSLLGIGPPFLLRV